MIERRAVPGGPPQAGRLAADGLRGLRAAYEAAWAREGFGERRPPHALVLRLLEARAGERILDVGCGSGGFLRAAAAAGLVPFGLDLALGALRRVRSAGLAPRLLLGQGERLPLPDAAFARVACLGSLEHFLDPAAGAREIARVLRPGGRAVVMLPNAYYSGDLWRLIRTGRGPDHHQAIDRFATCAEWRELLEASGLRVLAVRRWDKGKPWKRLLPFQLAYHFVFAAARG